MKKVAKIFLVIVLLIVGVIALTPDKKIKTTTKQLAKEANMSPFLANFIINTKLGRKLAYLGIKKEITKYIETIGEDEKEKK